MLMVAMMMCSFLFLMLHRYDAKNSSIYSSKCPIPRIMFIHTANRLLIAITTRTRTCIKFNVFFSYPTSSRDDWVFNLTNFGILIRYAVCWKLWHTLQNCTRKFGRTFLPGKTILFLPMQAHVFPPYSG